MALSREITQAFISMDYSDPVGKTVMDSEGCKAFVPGITEGFMESGVPISLPIAKG